MRTLRNIALVCLWLPVSSFAQGTQPVIDMHLHGAFEIGSFKLTSGGRPLSLPCYPQPCESQPALAQSRQDVQRLTFAYMDEFNIVLGALSDRPPSVHEWQSASDGKIIPALAVRQMSHINVNEMREQFRSGDYEILGEIGLQYINVAIDDPVLDSMFEMAQDLDVPVHIHIGGLGGGSDFPTHLGNPLRLSKVLRKYPRLRIYVENASWPFLEEITALMYIYPNVYADLSTITWIIPRDTFHDYLRGLIDNGLSKRLMFGSDQMMWPETIPMAIDAIESAKFLTAEQKRDIFYNNAARFLRLTEDEIATHHSN